MVGKGTFDALKDWQTLVGAMVASAAVWVAYINVSRQVRMNVVLREEKIISDEYPGVMDAGGFLAILNVQLDQAKDMRAVAAVLRKRKLQTDITAVRTEIEKLLPQTTLAIRSSIAAGISKVNFAIEIYGGFESLEEPSNEDQEYDFGFDEHEIDEEERVRGIAAAIEQMERAKGVLEELEVMLQARSVQWRDRLPKLRDEIERYLAA